MTQQNQHPLDETFDMETSEEVSDIFGMDIDIPDDPTMNTIVKFALQEYKNLAEQSKIVEPSDRLPILELAKDYLDLAKDTMHKESDISIKAQQLEHKIEQERKKQLPKDVGSGEGEEEKTTKAAVWDRLSQKKREQQESSKQ